MAYPLVMCSRLLAAKQLRKACFVLGFSGAVGAGSAQAQELYLNATVGGAFAPGVYGQISFGSQPPPPVLYAQPVWIQRAPVQPPPLYLYVPPGHSKNWAKFCGRYNACGRPVYFVKVNDSNRWWDHGRDGGRGPDRRDDRRQDFRQNDQGDHGHGRGHGNRKFDD